ncbi:hypothetical protein [Pseudoxanthomonas sp. Root630]|uniref:hypothetical protein n=1 Tax=Pseudoxanthomonas sp. Root630 TaxID=1736574 RepID=UPI000B0CE2AA|nr:hypothetical protein [Pseudoxanthomonas sp. Root630]
MSRLNCLSCAVFLTVLLSACASTQTARSSDKTLMQRQTDVDEVYVGYVNTVAKLRGTRVMWVHLPKKKAPETIAAAR